MKMFYCYRHQHTIWMFFIRHQGLEWDHWWSSGRFSLTAEPLRWGWRQADSRSVDGLKTMRNMSVWHDAAAAVSPKVLRWMLDISQAESQFLFQKRRSNYLLFKVTFLSMALEISLSLYLVQFVVFMCPSSPNEQNVYCIPLFPFIYRWQVITRR